MAKNQLWHDDYWLLLMQLYLRKPVGVKAMYSRPMVELSIELHIASRAVELLRNMMGFGSAGGFYDGVEVEETFERDFRPLAEDERLTPIMLIVILDQYFRLTPITMVAETPEVRQLSSLMHIPVSLVVDVLEVFQHCDPYLNRRDVAISPLLAPCQQIWQRYGNIDTRQLASYAEQLKEYFK